MSGCPLFGPSGPPSPDSCDHGRSDGISSVEIDGPRLQEGGQGATMLVMRIGVRGDAVPSCLAQYTTVTAQGGATVGHDSLARATYAQPDGSRATKDMYIVLDGYPYSLTVTTTVGAMTVTQTVGPPAPDLSVAPAVDMRGWDSGLD